MRHIVLSLVLGTFLCCITCNTASAQGWKDLLNQIGENSNVQDLVDDLLGTSSPVDITGTWIFEGSAISLESDNFLNEMAGDLAAATVAEKLDTYLSQIGLKAGAFSYQFGADSTFTNTFKKTSLKGTYRVNHEEKTICLSYNKTIQLLQLNGIIERNGDQLKLLFPADKLLKFLETISKSSKNEMLVMLGELAQKYDGMNLGFNLKLQGSR